MTVLALALVLCAALLHAIWNLLYKRARDKPSFAWLFGVAAVVMYFPVFLLLLGRQPIPDEGWYLVLASGTIHSFYFAFLGRGYALGDLSLVYPLSRGIAPLLVPLWTGPFLGERVSALGLAGVLTVVSGVYVLHLRELSRRGLLAPVGALKAPASRMALVTGLLISFYTVVDGRAVRYVEPMVYMYLFMACYSLFYGPYVLGTSGRAKVEAEWRANALPILAVGFLVVSTYVMVLFAMTMSQVAYVAASREMSVVFGAAMGTILLKESYGRAKVGGSVLIALGVALIGLARP